jgi:hypothetical protein
MLNTMVPSAEPIQNVLVDGVRHREQSLQELQWSRELEFLLLEGIELVEQPVAHGQFLDIFVTFQLNGFAIDIPEEPLALSHPSLLKACYDRADICLHMKVDQSVNDLIPT